MRDLKITELLKKYPYLENYFETIEISIEDVDATLGEVVENLQESYFEENAILQEELLSGVEEFIKSMEEFLGVDNSLKSLTILPGFNKDGVAEDYKELTLKPSQIISVVGPTGSGKSRLLEDIEWIANGDTPSGRRILINGEPRDLESRFSNRDKLVAQLSQNMNFVMDLTVGEFLKLHCSSRFVDPSEKIPKIIEEANRLTGEEFSLESEITSLSGGQSRALMISDTANLSKSPIVLIDELENAGIDKAKAIELLLSKEKIVFIATHDPSLALMADTRLVIKNGGISKIITTSNEEKEVLKELIEMDNRLSFLRGQLRVGEELKTFK